MPLGHDPKHVHPYTTRTGGTASAASRPRHPIVIDYFDGEIPPIMYVVDETRLYRRVRQHGADGEEQWGDDYIDVTNEEAPWEP